MASLSCPRLQGGSQVVVGLGEVWPQTQGRAYVFDGEIVVAQLIGDQAEQVHGINVLRFHLQDLPIKLLRLLQIARLMLLHGQRHRVRHGEHAKLLCFFS